MRHGGIPLSFLAGGGALAQRRATLVLHTLNGVLLYQTTFHFLRLRRDISARDQDREWGFGQSRDRDPCAGGGGGGRESI